MNIARPILPKPPRFRAEKIGRGELEENFVSLQRFADDLILTLDRFFAVLIMHTTDILGEDLHTADMIRPTSPVHRLSGPGSISQINAAENFTGPLALLVLDGEVTLETGGNIGSQVVLQPGMAVTLYYDGNAWYPDRG